MNILHRMHFEAPPFKDTSREFLRMLEGVGVA